MYSIVSHLCYDVFDQNSLPIPPNDRSHETYTWVFPTSLFRSTWCFITAACKHKHFNSSCSVSLYNYCNEHKHANWELETKKESMSCVCHVMSYQMTHWLLTEGLTEGLTADCSWRTDWLTDSSCWWDVELNWSHWTDTLHRNELNSEEGSALISRHMQSISEHKPLRTWRLYALFQLRTCMSEQRRLPHFLLSPVHMQETARSSSCKSD